MVMGVSYLTVPEVFLKTVAAKLCVTPTRLVPSTSTMRSGLVLKLSMIRKRFYVKK